MAVKRVNRDLDPSVAVFARCWTSVADRLSPALARQVIRLGFSESDQRRMSELAERNSAGSLSSLEQQELDGYIRAGDMMAILHSAARRRLKSLGAGTAENG